MFGSLRKRNHVRMKNIFVWRNELSGTFEFQRNGLSQEAENVIQARLSHALKTASEGRFIYNHDSYLYRPERRALIEEMRDSET